MPEGWRPRIQKIEQLIQEEEARAEVLKQQVYPSWTPPVSSVSDTITFPAAPPIPPIEPPVWTPQPLWQPQQEVTRVLPAPEPEMPSSSIKMLQATETPPWLAPAKTPPEEVQWWEKPKVITERASEAAMRAAMKVPVLPEALEFVAPAFEFIHEKLEKPFAAIITAPFSPSLPWQAGEGWLEHAKREYDTWKAPTYVKGLAEFAMPLWWMPWFTWVKGAKALATGEKLARGMKLEKALELPSKEVLNASYKQDWFRSLAHWSENKPFIGGVIKAVGGEAAFARNVGEVFPAMDIKSQRLVVVNKAGVNVPVTDVVRREIVNRSVLEDMRHGYKGLQLPRMQALAPRGDMVKALQVDDWGRVMAATPKKVTLVTPEVTYLQKWATNILEKVKILDAEKAADVAYRDLLSTATKTPLKKGETWRSRVVSMAEKSKPATLPALAPEVGVDVSTLSRVAPKTFPEYITYIKQTKPTLLGRYSKFFSFLDSYSKLAVEGKGFPESEVNKLYSAALKIADYIKQTEKVTIKQTETINKLVTTAQKEPTRLNKVILIDGIISTEHKTGNIIVPYFLEPFEIGAKDNPFVKGILDELAGVKLAIPKAEVSLGRGLSDVFENPDLYTYSSKEVEAIVREGNKILTEIFDLARKEGVKVPKKPFLHRLVEGKEVAIGDKTVYEASEYGAKFEKARHYLTMEEGINAGVRYGRDPLRSISATIDHYFRQIAGKRFDDEVGKLGLTIPEMVSLIEPGLIENMATLGTRLGAASYLAQTLKTLKAYKGDSIPGAVASKIRRGMPDAMEKIEQAFSLSPIEATKMMDSLAKEIGKATKLKSKDLKVLIAQFGKTPGKILVREIDDMVRSLNLTNEAANKALRQIYKNAYNLRKQAVDDTLKAVRNEADELIKATKAELSPLKAEYRRLSLPYREGTGQIFGGLAKFRMHPAFRNRIFDADVVKMAEATEGRRGGEWVRNIAQASSIGRLAIAALDFSAPFIQGLAVLGRNPVAWSKAVGQQFRFFKNPDAFFQYMMQDKVRALAAERWAHGGSRSSFEFFEALAPIQRAAEKAPKGQVIRRGIQETYGRAEVAFSGFGEAARNYMWEALRVKALQPDGTLAVATARELARSIDRMTGVMSMEALGIGRGQIDFEGAWIFFAPRYTRAGMSYVADMMKGGIAGAEARKGLGSLMAAGMTYYYGVTTALGQQPNLDINSARFMTVKIGDDYVGVGGILYSLARLGANVVGTAADPETRADFLTLSRFDNPFVKFMFSRSSVVTGTITGALEQRNFFGEPLESVGDWGKFMAEKALPIAAQRAILEPEHRNPIVFTAEILGGRTFPMSAWALQEQTKDRLAQSEHGMPYDNLDLLQKRRIDTHPEVLQFNEEIEKQTTNRGKKLSVAFMERGKDLDDARFIHKEMVENLQRAFEAGVITGFEFKEGVREADIGYGATYEHISKNPRYADAVKKLEEPREINREYRWELAYDEMIQATSGGMFEDQFRQFDFQAYRDFLDSLKLKYGEADFNRAMELRNEKYAEYPPLFQELQQAKELMRPYWEVRTRVVKLFGERFADSPKGNALVSKMRKAKRLADPNLERVYQRFYTQ